ncbi:nicotinamide mononucleotide transporter [Acinetobacter calcoaceticus]|uniref:Nicotinamide riboside transporter PnuC n=1 Tax=Acinetobacter calcoaceticus TaxID=471 RepID=A0A4R1Y187_ACICA|nr:nicotinamide mononucleotide transporter [Acinetobacter calcoaceticus]
MSPLDVFAVLVSMMSPLEAFAVLVSILGVSLTIRRSIWCWMVNLVAVSLYAYLFYEVKLYGEVILQTIFMGMNVYGFYHWSQAKQHDHEIRIAVLGMPKALLQIGMAVVGGLAFGSILHFFTDAAVPFLDAQLAAFSLLGTYWTSQKHIATWMLWVVVDIIYVGMFSYKELYLTAVLYGLFVGLAGFGWWQWLQVKNKQQGQQQSKALKYNAEI